MRDDSFPTGNPSSSSSGGRSRFDKPAKTGREVSARVLQRVLNEGAWAAPALDAELRRASLSSGETGRATDLVYGALRRYAALNAAIDAWRPRKDPLEPFTHAALLSATYELLHTDEKAWAILDETVGLISYARAPGLGRFANAVLRKISSTRPAQPMPVTSLAFPSWMQSLLARDLGSERAQIFGGDRPMPPPVSLRVRGDREALAEAIRAARPTADVTLGRVSTASLSVRGAGDPRHLPGYAEGRFVVQDEGSLLVGEAVDAQPGERVLDACAGRGGKTLVMLDQVGPTGEVTAIDDHAEKLLRMDDELTRLGHKKERVERFVVDLTVGLGPLEGSFDRVLVDAPCTGLGTVHRRPEIMLRAEPTDPMRMHHVQVRITETVMPLVRAGGTLIYAVCSPTRAEGIDVVTSILSRHPEFELLHAHSGNVPADEDGMLRIGPWLAPGLSCDAFQVARLRRKS